MGEMSYPLCDKCGKPVRDGEARYAAVEARHAACHDWRTPKEKLAELEEMADRLKKKLSSIQTKRK